MVDIDKCVLKVFELLHIDKIDKGAISLYSIFNTLSGPWLGSRKPSNLAVNAMQMENFLVLACFLSAGTFWSHFMSKRKVVKV